MLLFDICPLVAAKVRFATRKDEKKFIIQGYSVRFCLKYLPKPKEYRIFESWNFRHGSNTIKKVTEAIQHIVNRGSMQYEGLVLFLTDNQLSLLKAIAKADCVKSPQSNEFIKTYELPSASSVKTALTVLVDKDLVYHDARGYTVYDRFFDLWLKQLV